MLPEYHQLFTYLLRFLRPSRPLALANFFIEANRQWLLYWKSASVP
jgi:hypothetical protein